MDPRERFNSDGEASIAATLGVRQLMWTALPGIIVSFDAEKMTAVVQPAIKGIRRKQDGTLTNDTIPPCPDVPVVFPGGGGYALTFPVKKDDECLLVFGSRNIDGWWDQGGVQNPLDNRLFDLSDGFAFVGVRSKPKVIADISTSNVQLRTDDGANYLEIDKAANTIKIVATTKLRIESPLVEITGDLNVEGEIRAKSETDNIHVTTHNHSGVRSGPDETDEPVPGT